MSLLFLPARYKPLNAFTSHRADPVEERQEDGDAVDDVYDRDELSDRRGWGQVAVAKKGDWDVGIAMDVMRLAPKLDTIILVSGDGDFSDLLEHAKSLGCRTEVVAFGKTTSYKLKDVADFFLDLDKDKDYLLKKRKK